MKSAAKGNGSFIVGRENWYPKFYQKTLIFKAQTISAFRQMSNNQKVRCYLKAL